MFCEASSGTFAFLGSDRLRIGHSERAALGALGFVRANSETRFGRDIELGDPPDVTIAADLMLVARHDGYGARLGSPIEIRATYGGDPVAPCGTPES